MCGRGFNIYGIEELDIRFGRTAKNNLPKDLKPNYNLAPTQLTPVVFVENGQLTFDLFRWGLIRTWAKDIQSRPIE